MKAANRVVMNTGVLYGRMAITVFISLYSTRLVLNALGVNDFGIYSVIAGAIAMLTFLNAAMANATQRFISYTEGAGDVEKVKSVFNVSIILHIIIAVILYLLLQAIGYFLFEGFLNIPEARIKTAKLIYQFLLISTFFTVISVPYDAVINAHEHMTVFAVFGIIESLFKLAIAIYITYTSFDQLISYGFLTAVSAILLLLGRRVYCHKRYNECQINLKKYFRKPVFREMTGFAGWTFLGTSSGMLSNYGQIILINIFFGPVINAAQGVAVQISAQLSVLANTMLKALNPLIDKSEGSGNRDLMLKTSMIGGKISFLLLSFSFVPILVEMPFIFKIWLKNVPEYAVIFCSLQLIRNLIEQLFLTLTSSIAAVGNIRKYQIYSSALTFFPLVLSYALFKMHYPAYTLYIVYILYALLTAILTVYFAKKNCGLVISFYLRSVVIKSVFVFILVFAIANIPVLIINEGALRLLIVILSSSISFIIIAWLIGFSQSERIEIKKMLKSIFHKINLKRISYSRY